METKDRKPEAHDLIDSGLRLGIEKVLEGDIVVLRSSDVTGPVCTAEDNYYCVGLVISGQTPIRETEQVETNFMRFYRQTHRDEKIREEIMGKIEMLNKSYGEKTYFYRLDDQVKIVHPTLSKSIVFSYSPIPLSRLCTEIFADNLVKMYVKAKQTKLGRKLK